MRTIVFLFFLFPATCFSQAAKDPVLTDTSIAVGIIREGGFVGNHVDNYCLKGIDKYLDKGVSVLISGIEVCKDRYSSSSTSFFQIMYNRHTYYIEKDKLLTRDSYYNQLKAMSSATADSFRAHARYISELLHEGSTRKALQFLDKCKPKGIAILEWSIYDESEYTDGTGVKIKVYNPTSKTIKYIWFTFTGYNPVGDRVVDYKRGSSVTMKGVGPIKPDESGSYEYTYVWFTDLVETAKVT